MALIDELRKNPAYADFSDDEIADGIKALKPEYADFSTDEVKAVITEPGSERFLASLMQPAEIEQAVTLGDFGRSVMAGGAGLVEGVGALTGAEGLRDIGKSSREYWERGYTPAFRREMAKPFITDDWGIGEGLTSPTKIAGVLTGSALPMGLGIGLGALAAKSLQAAGMGATAAGVTGGAVGEGTTAGAMSAGDIFNRVMEVPEDVIVTTEPYQRAYWSLPDTMPDAQRRAEARKQVATSAARDGATWAAMATAILGAPSGAAMGKLIAGETGKSLPRTIGKQAFLEGVVQEAPQSAAEQVAANRAVRDYADPSQTLSEGVGEAVVGGLVAGSAMGGGMAPAMHYAGQQARSGAPVADDIPAVDEPVERQPQAERTEQEPDNLADTSAAIEAEDYFDPDEYPADFDVYGRTMYDLANDLEDIEPGLADDIIGRGIAAGLTEHDIITEIQGAIRERTPFAARAGARTPAQEPSRRPTTAPQGRPQPAGATQQEVAPPAKPPAAPGPAAVTPTHELPDGTPVIATDEPNVWVDADGNEYEDNYAQPIQAAEGRITGERQAAGVSSQQAPRQPVAETARPVPPVGQADAGRADVAQAAQAGEPDARRQPVAFPITTNPKGSITVKGDPEAIRSALQAAGVPHKGLKAKNGITFSKNHAEAVRNALDVADTNVGDIGQDGEAAKETKSASSKPPAKQGAQQPAQAGEKAPQVADPRNDIADETPVVIINKRTGQAVDIGIYRGTDARTGSARVEVAPGEISFRHPDAYEIRPMSGDGRSQAPAEKSEPTVKAKRGRAGAAALKKLAEAAGLPLDDTANRDTADMIAFFDRFYEAGRDGRDMPRADIHPQDARAAYEAGRKDREAASQAPKAPQAAAGDGPAATDGNARPAPAATMQSKEVADDDRQATVGAADQGAPEQGAGSVQPDGEGRDAEGVSGRPDGRDAGSDHGRGAGRNRRAGERGEPDVRARSDEADAGDQHGAEGGRRDRAGAGDRDDRGPVSRVGSNYRIQPGELKRTGSWKATAEQNVRIVELVKQLEAEGRRPTPEEAALLTKFTGWGATEIANGIFPDRYGRYKDATWQALGERLKAALTPEEYAQARRTTQYAHYTSEGVIRSIYDGLRRLGFAGGRVLEPGMGIGLFNGLMPADMAASSQYTGVEYDGITGAIAKLLYPQSNVIVGDYTKTALPRDFFDVAIGNPPFGSIAITNDPEYKKHGFMLHDYFFAKTIDRVKPGGLLVFVTSKGTMDKANDRARKYLAERANLLGAIRLPQTAFKDNAGTEVVTDVIFLQKRGPGIKDNGVKWLGTVDVQTPQGPATINEYFAAHPEMVLGAHALTGSMYRANEYTVVPEPGVDLEQAFARAVANLPEGVYRPGAKNPVAAAAVARERDFNPTHKKEGGLYVAEDGRLMQVESGTGVKLTHRRGANGKLIALKPNDKAFLKSWVGLRDALKQAQLDQLTDGDWQKSLKALGEAYDAFVKKHGNLLAYTTIERQNEDGTVTVTKRFKNWPLLRLDVDGALAYSLERVTESGEIVKAPVLSERVLEKKRPAEIKTTQDALFVSLNNLGRLDLDDVARLAGMSRQEVIDALGTAIYEAPGAGWQTADEYLSGNVVRKLKEAQAAARADKRFQRNVDALLAVQPKPLGPTEITVKLGQNWIPPSDIMAFAREVLNEDIRVSYNPRLGVWSAEQNGSNYSEFNTPKMSAGAILDAVLNNRTIRVTYRDQEGKTHVDAEATEKANDVARKMREAFGRWIWTDTKRADRLVNYYNENFNNIAPRQFDGSHLTLPGVSLRFNLYPHQKRAIWRAIQEGDTYLAHSVGAGKTFTMIAAGMEERRLGLSNKPMYVVPNHMLAQFAREFLELYPAANIMVADEENFHTHNRRRFVAQAALNDPDAIIITHSAFSRIGMSDEFYERFITDQIEEWKRSLDEADQHDRITRKQIERRIEQLERRLEARQGKDKKDTVLSFEELGVDRLFVDEAHEFRKLDFPTNQGNIKGIDPAGSQRAMDLFMKVQYLRSKKPGRALVMASGTPITNTMGELFTVQRFFQPDQLAEDGLDTFDAWASQYGEVVSGFEQNAAGGYEVVSRFAKFQNVPELMRRVRSFMDILTSSSLGELVQRPAVKGGGREIVVTPEPDGYRAYQKELEARINAIRRRNGPPKKGEDIILNVIADGRFSAIDMRFVDPSLPPDPKSKLNQALDDLIAAYFETADHEYTTNGQVDPIKGSSLILFTDIGLGEQSAKSRGFDMKAWIEKRLTDAGIPREHIAFMRDYKEHAKKERLFADMREGKKRILIGGKDMETGVNVQKRLTHLFHLDAPWFPASVEQREGRIVRQGNQNKEVVIRAYATKGSYDSTMWGMNGRKARFIEQAMNGDDSVRSLEDVSEASAFEMASALASGDERYLRLAGLRADVQRLERLASAHHDDQNKLRRDKHWAEASIEHNRKLVAELKEAIAKRTPIRAGEFVGKVGNNTYDKRDEFSKAVFAQFRDLTATGTRGEKQIGEIGGFPITFHGGILNGTGNYYATVEVGVPGDHEPLLAFPLDPDLAVGGIATRAANQVNSLDRLLSEAEAKIEQNQRRIEQISQRLGAPFPEQRELLEKMAEMQALEAELTAEKAAEGGEPVSADAAAATVEVEGSQKPEAPKYSLAAGIDRETHLEELNEKHPLRFSVATSTAPRTSADLVAELPQRLSDRWRQLTEDAIYRGSRPAAGMKAADVRAAIAPVILTWGDNAPAVEVVENQSGLPDHIRRQIGEGGMVQGVHDSSSGTVYIVAGALANKKDAMRILAHEAVGHFGLEESMGDTYQKAVDRVKWLKRAGNKKILAIADRVASAYPGIDANTEAREILAHLAEERQFGGVLKDMASRIYAAVRQFLRRMGFRVLWSTPEIDAMLARAARYLRESGGRRRAISEALEHPQLGEIDVALGKGRMGASKFVAEHPEIGANLEDLIAGSKVVSRDAETATLENGGVIFGLIKKAGRWVLTDARADFARSDDTQGAYESRIDELFAGEKPSPHGVRVLDRSDVLNLLGYGDLPIHVAEGKVSAGQYNHGLTAEHWKKIPEWLENPVAVFDSDTVAGRLVFVAPDAVRGAPVVMIVEPETTMGRVNVHLLVNAYEKTGRLPVQRWVEDGLLRYLDEKQSPVVSTTTGLRLPRVVHQQRGSKRRVLTQRDLVKARSGPTASGLDFSRAASMDILTEASTRAGEVLADLLKRPGVFGPLARTLQTQYHKATKSPQFRAVWERAHAMFMQSARAMSRPASLAPTLLPKFDTSNFMDALKATVTGRGHVAPADIAAAAEALNAGTLYGGPSPLEGRVFTPDELRDGVDLEDGRTIRLTDTQIRLYLEARAAIDASLTETAAAEAWGVVKQYTEDARLRQLVAEQPHEAEGMLMGLLKRAKEDAAAELRRMARNASDAVAEIIHDTGITPAEKLERLRALPARDNAERAAAQAAVVADLTDSQARVGAIFSKSRALQKAGYVPLMRFGRYRVSVVMEDEAGVEVEFVARYESAFEANRARRKLIRQYPAEDGYVVSEVEVMNDEKWRMFQGVNPETVMLFAEEAGIQADEVMQSWYKEAVSNRSALRRMVHRKGYAGFSEDLPRVLASFITSNGKRVGYAYHLGDMQRMINQDMPGDVQEEAQKLLETITNPERGMNIRGLMATWYLLGSVASSMVNMTQTLTMSLPWLAQYGKGGFAPGQASKAMVSAYKQIMGTVREDTRAALKRAEEEGVVDSNEVFHLYAEAMKPMISKLGSGRLAYRARAFMTLWGAPFAIAEKLNRKATFIAAYQMAMENGKTPGEAFQFAEKAVIETQGIYSAYNRPNWARGPIGGAVMTFKQFSIAYVEMLARMAKAGPEGQKAALLALAILFFFAGASGLPGEDDLLDIIDTFAQVFFGKATVSRLEIRNALHEALGETMGDFVNYGISAFLPLDVSARLGLGDLLPGTAILKPSAPNKAAEAMEALGVAGSFGRSLIDGAGAILQGEFGRAARIAAPKAVGDVLKGLEMAVTGEARDMAGRKIVDASVVDAVVQAIGFQPATKGKIQRSTYEIRELIGYHRMVERGIVLDWARGVADGDRDKIAAARRRLKEWNANNPDLPIRINMKQIWMQVRQLKMEKTGRIEKTAPREIRRQVMEMTG